MKYDFDSIVPRRGTGSLKWDMSSDPDILPLWVADMDFLTAGPVRDAVMHRAEHGIYGYAMVPEAYYEAVTGWFAKRHGWNISREWIVPVTGVIPALSAVLRALVPAGGKVMVLSPVYNHFFITLENNGCEAVPVELLREGDRYVIDFDALEEKAADPAISLMIMCNPQNPAGRVWTVEELRRVGEICLRNNVFVVSDEIHCELTMPGFSYTPYASVGERAAENSVTCLSPTKPFNMAGLQVANMVIPDESIRERVRKVVETCEVGSPGPFGIDALIAAYSEGGAEWLDQLNAYVYENYRFMKDFCHDRLPDFALAELEGTYLVWMDCSSLGMSSAELEEILKREAGIWLNAGTMYGSGGEGYMRWNIACPRRLLEEALARFSRFADKRKAAVNG